MAYSKQFFKMNGFGAEMTLERLRETRYCYYASSNEILEQMHNCVTDSSTSALEKVEKLAEMKQALDTYIDGFKLFSLLEALKFEELNKRFMEALEHNTIV